MKTINYLYLSLMCFFLFFFLTIFIINGNVIFFDDLIYNFLHQFPLTSFFRVITELGGVMDIVIVMVLYLLGSKSKKNVQFFLALMLLNTVANFVLKQFFVRSRPYYEKLVSASGFSFPSGHTSGFTSILCFLEWRKNRYEKPSIVRTIIIWMLIIYMPISRMAMGAHFLSDTAVGFLMTYSWYLFYRRYYRRREVL